KVDNKDWKEIEIFIRKLNKLGITRILTSLALRKFNSFTNMEKNTRL
ncbi:Lrp/AsnC family transcriptional regulator, partial [Peribacillus simplex]